MGQPTLAGGRRYDCRMYLIRIVFLLFLPLSLTNCLRWSPSDRELTHIFNEEHLPLAIHHVESAGIHLRYVEVRRAQAHGQPALPNVLMVHGSPSSLRVWMGYLTDTALARVCNMYAVDRPGYGYSDFGKADTSIEHEAEVIEEVLRRHPGHWVIQGSSYGGPIAALLAARNPDKIMGVLLTSPALAPGEEKTYKISYIINKKALGWAFPAIFRVANEEKLSHKNALKRIVTSYKDIVQPVTYIYGGQDGLVYNSNATYAEQHFTGTKIKFIKLNDRPHFFTFAEQGLITKELVSLLDLTQPPITSTEKIDRRKAGDSSRAGRRYTFKPMPTN